MLFKYPTEWPQFYTATIQHWLPLLNPDENKKIITKSLLFLVQDHRIELNAFVIMKNHIHLIWQPLRPYSLSSIHLVFMKFTAQQIKFALSASNSELLEQCRVDKSDRKFQIWKRRALSIELRSEKVFLQKLGYIHNNPVKAGICDFPEEYYFSSALFYQSGEDHFKMLTHYDGESVR